MLHPQAQHGNQAFGVHLFAAMQHTNIRFELLGSLNKHLRWSGVQTGGIIYDKV